MNSFEQTFLLCNQPLGLIPGPAHFQEPFYSIVMQDAVALYPAAEVAATFSNLERVRCVAQPEITTVDDWYAWKWLWQRADRHITIDFTIFDTDADGYWGGSELLPYCTFVDVLLFWQTIQRHYPLVWLHDADCQVLTVHSFLEKHALARLQPALSAVDPMIRSQAEQALAEYHKLDEQDRLRAE